MALALDDLGGAAPGPDRLADAAQGSAGATVAQRELVPGGDDPGRVAAHLLHGLESAQVGVDAAGELGHAGRQHFEAGDGTATSTGSPACRALSMKGMVPARYSPSSAYMNAGVGETGDGTGRVALDHDRSAMRRSTVHCRTSRESTAVTVVSLAR